MKGVSVRLKEEVSTKSDLYTTYMSVKVKTNENSKNHCKEKIIQMYNDKIRANLKKNCFQFNSYLTLYTVLRAIILFN